MEKREPKLEDFIAFMKLMGLNNLSTQRDFDSHRIYVTIEPIEEETEE